MTILCVGALALDTIFRLDELPAGPGKFLPLDAIDIAEGMATAQAATIARLGGAVRLWASAGDDDRGDRLVAELASEGIDTSAIRRVPGARSGFSSIFMDRAGERMIVPRYDATLLSPPDILPRFDDVTVVSADVRWPEAAARALALARENAIPGVLDLERAPAEVLQRLVPRASHIVASDPGIEAFTGIAEPMAALKALAAIHPGVVVVTAGEKGCWWFDRESETPRHVPALKLETIDTLAAGDVFHGAFALRLAEGADLDAALRFASVAAALKCTRFGGRRGAPTRAEVEAMLPSLG
jgi:sulfofructose kinase